jgi:ferrous iron transport protein B
MSAPPLVVALVGNPNAGKSTLFNALSGLRQHTGNYPGVTVESKSGRFRHAGREVEVIDLPGTYSLAARSPDEMVVVDVLLGRRPEHPRPDVVVSVVDASNLDRHLYLTTQLLDLGRPVVLAVNMADVADGQGVRVAPAVLAKETGLPVVMMQANRGVGLDLLKDAIVSAAGGPAPTVRPRLPAEVEGEIDGLSAALGGAVPAVLAARLLLDVNGFVEQRLTAERAGLAGHLAGARGRLAVAGHPVPACEARARYAWVRGVSSKAVGKPAVRADTQADRLDRLLTHRVWGTLAFAAVMFLLFQSIFVAAEPVMGLIDDGTAAVAGAVEDLLPVGPVRSLLADGVVTGVGGVVKFLPQILMLFGFLAVLEDCGYMARAAFLMDRLMSRCGLSGKSFIPLLSSVACAVPGVMATRVIENRRDRLATIVVAPLMSCSARLPVYALLIGAFLTDGFAWWVPGTVLFGLYLIGFVVAPLVALVLKRTLLRGDVPLFVMELPAFRRPSLRNVVRRMADAGWAFLRRAGTVILASMVLVWGLLYFPDRDAAGRFQDRIEVAKGLGTDDGDAEAIRLRGEWQRQSLLGRAGRALEPAFAPLGWDWRVGTAALASFPAREVIVGTLGILYEAGDEDDERLQEAVRREWAADPVRGRYAVATAASVLVFFALCMQCASTLAVIRRESGGWAWPAFTFAYMTALAYLGALVTFQVGRLLIDAAG